MTVLVQLHTALCFGLVSVLPAVVYEFTWNCLKSKFSPIMLCRDSPSLSSVTRSSASLTSVARWHTCEGSKGMGRKGRKKKRAGTNVLVCLSPKLCYDKSQNLSVPKRKLLLCFWTTVELQPSILILHIPFLPTVCSWDFLDADECGRTPTGCSRDSVHANACRTISAK